MNKKEFLEKLEKSLSGLPKKDIEERLAFYSEMIDDQVEEGISEEEAVSKIGPINNVTNQIVADTSIVKIVKEKMRPKRKLQAWEIILIILGSPLWFPLLVAAFSVLLSVYIVIWSVIITLWALELALALVFPAGIVMFVVNLIRGNAGAGFAHLGIAFVCAGLAIVAFFGCLKVTKEILVLTKRAFLGFKKLFIGKENKEQ